VDEILYNNPGFTFSEPQIKYMVRGTVEALFYLHETQYVIHRDMKASNILLTENNEVKLADFSVSAKNPTFEHRINTFIGTPYWMSPEIIACETDKNMSYDYKTDIWSLGITCIELAERDPPHNEVSPQRVLFRILKSEEEPGLKEPSKWSADFKDFLSKCLKRDQFVRFTSSQLLKVFFC
jgi:serine/threonine protein kinase